MDLQLVKNYRDNHELRRSFNQLAAAVFGIDFDPWYERGFWSDRYVCHSLAANGRIVSNVSVSKMELLLDGVTIPALQIGTVMTHPQYRHQGLLRQLMEDVLSDYDQDYELIFLTGDQELNDFYPKFGFRPMRESSFSLGIDKAYPKKPTMRKLDPRKRRDAQLIKQHVVSRQPISRVCGALGAESITLWYCYNILDQSFHYMEEQDILVVFGRNGDKVCLFDIIGRDEIDFPLVQASIISEQSRQIDFYFTPDLFCEASCHPKESDDIFFVRGSFPLTKPFTYPMTAQA